MFPILADRRNGAAGLLSGGEQQMLAFGRALMSQPERHDARRAVDGPGARRWSTRCWARCATWPTPASASCMVEQNAEVGLEVADEVVVVARGEVVFSGPAEQAR